MPKALLMDFFKKRKGLRQGGKEGLKTSARNPLSANTPRSDKSSFHLLSGKLFCPNLQILVVNAVFRVIFCHHGRKSLLKSIKIFFCFMEHFRTDPRLLITSLA
jgi:hypothetical protein